MSIKSQQSKPIFKHLFVKPSEVRIWASGRTTCSCPSCTWEQNKQKFSTFSISIKNTTVIERLFDAISDVSGSFQNYYTKTTLKNKHIFFLPLFVWQVQSEHVDLMHTELMDSPLLKLDLGLPPGFALESRVPEDILVDDSFVQRNIHRVSEGNRAQGWKNVI